MIRIVLLLKFILMQGVAFIPCILDAGPPSGAPDFLIIGAMKSGTKQLGYLLRQHPSIILPCEGYHFFSDPSLFKKGLDYYESLFPVKTNPNQMKGEKTPAYIFFPEVPQRVFEAYPQIKLIVILRNPVDRAYSHYQFSKRKGAENLSFESALELENERILINNEEYLTSNFRKFSYLLRGHYAEQLKRWLEYFPKEQMLVVLSEELRSNKMDVLNRICGFLNIEPFSFLPEEYQDFTSSYPPLKEEIKERLINYYRSHNQHLEELLQIELPWNF